MPASAVAMEVENATLGAQEGGGEASAEAPTPLQQSNGQPAVASFGGLPLSIPEGPHGQTALQICPRSFTLRASRRPPEEAKDEVLGRQIVQLSRFDAGF